MNSTLISFALLCISSILITERTRAQENPSEVAREYDLSRLDLSPATHNQLKEALEQKNYQTAEKILVEEAERDPTSLRAARIFEFSGGLFFLDGQYVNSVIAWKKAEAIAPLDERTRFTLAMAYIKVNRRSWARSELDRLAQAHPDNSLYLYWLSRVDYDDQKYLEAIRRLERVIQLNPNMVRAHDLLGLCYDYLGQFNEAITSFNRAVELNRVQAKPSPWPPLDMAVTQMELDQLAKRGESSARGDNLQPKIAASAISTRPRAIQRRKGRAGDRGSQVRGSVGCGLPRPTLPPRTDVSKARK